MDNHDWVRPYIERAIEFLGLHAWTWNISTAQNLEGVHGTHEHKASATCDADWAYLHAEIVVDRLCWETQMADPDQRVASKVLLCHEVSHILLAQLASAMEALVNIYFPTDDGSPADKSTAFTLYAKNEEHVVTRLSRQVYEALERDEELERLRDENNILSRRVLKMDQSDDHLAVTG